jgi:membrane protease YdiL (CAAX protease family)
VRKQKNNPFPYWLALFLLVLLFQATSFLVGLYLLAEIFRNGNRWLAFGIVVFLNLLLLLAISFLNKKMSEGLLGSAMQKIRTSRFTAAFLTVMIASLLGALFVYLIDEVLYPSVALTPFGPIAVLLVSLGAVLEFIFTYYLFQGQGISRL